MNEEPDVTVPSDFPRDYGVGAVSGAQPKLLARKIGDRYIGGITGEELYARYDNCCDLVIQLERYCHRKLIERPEWTVNEVLAKVRVTLHKRHEWDLSAGEIDWMMGKLAAKLNAPGADAASEGAD